MSKQLSRKKNSVSKVKPNSVWGKAIRETEQRLQEARRRVAQLEEARESFLKLAAEGVPPPTGEESNTHATPAT